MSRAAPHRRADPSRGRRLAPRAARGDRPVGRSTRVHGMLVLCFLLVVTAATACLCANLAGVLGVPYADAGAVAISTAYAGGLAARSGGRPVVFALLALLLGLGVLAADTDPLRSGAAVVTAVLSAVFGVMVTVPAVHVTTAARENAVALVVAALGALATLAWAPVVNLERFEYTTLGLSLITIFWTVYRLGAGIHGLGTRGLVAVVFGGLVLALTLGYAELLRRYGSQSVVDGLDEAARWSHHHLGAFPRPIVALLGVPALTWGTHMRARRRQGWWVCAFGIAVTAPVTYGLLDPARSVAQVALALGYGAVIGLVIGFLLIRVDLAVTGPSGRRGGRRIHETERASAVRPEPGRTHALW